MPKRKAGEALGDAARPELRRSSRRAPSTGIIDTGGGVEPEVSMDLKSSVSRKVGKTRLKAKGEEGGNEHGNEDEMIETSVEKVGKLSSN